MHPVEEPLVRRAPVLAEAAAALTSAVLTMAGTAWVLQLGRAALDRPFHYWGDALYYQGMIKTTVKHGWYLNNPDLGFPQGMHSHDFPLLSLDSLHLAIVRVIGLFSGNVFVVTNVFYLLTYPLCALAAYWALRRLGASRASSVVCSVLYALLPYHVMRSEHHLFLGSYYVIPIACVLVLELMKGDALFEWRGPRRVLGWATPRTLRTTFLCLLLASGSAYYFAFAIVLLGAAALMVGLAQRDWRRLGTGFVTVLVIILFAGLNLTPNLLHRLTGDPNPAVLHREPREAERFALKLDQLVFPINGHRIDALERFASHFENTSVLPSEPSANLGIVGTTGFVWLLVVGLAGLTGMVHGRLGSERERHAAFVTFVAFGVATVGGVSAVIAYTLTPEIRSWNRMSVVIAFMALLAVALLLDRLRAWVKPGRAHVAATLAIFLLVPAGVWDQTSPHFVPDYAGEGAWYDAVRTFVASAERVLPARSAVFQLPYMAFPETGPIKDMRQIDQIRPYLSSKTLRWSFGAMQGSMQDWHATFAGAPLHVLLDVAAASGFAAVYVDRFGYTDRAAALEADLRSTLGGDPGPMVTSTDDRLALWDLRPYAARLRALLGDEQFTQLGRDGTHPVRAAFTKGFTVPDVATGVGGHIGEHHAVIELRNPMKHSRRIVFRADLLRTSAGNGKATVRFPDGSAQDVALTQTPARLEHEFDAPPGDSVIGFTITGDPAPPAAPGLPILALDIRDVLVVPAAACVGQRSPAVSTDIAACTTGPHPQVP